MGMSTMVDRVGARTTRRRPHRQPHGVGHLPPMSRAPPDHLGCGADRRRPRADAGGGISRAPRGALAGCTAGASPPCLGGLAATAREEHHTKTTSRMSSILPCWPRPPRKCCPRRARATRGRPRKVVCARHLEATRVQCPHRALDWMDAGGARGNGQAAGRGALGRSRRPGRSLQTTRIDTRVVWLIMASASAMMRDRCQDRQGRGRV
jgi:hypothetical protein